MQFCAIDAREKIPFQQRLMQDDNILHISKLQLNQVHYYALSEVLALWQLDEARDRDTAIEKKIHIPPPRKDNEDWKGI